MTVNTLPENPTPEETVIADEERRRRILLLILLGLLLALCCVAFFFVRYLLAPQPLPEMVPAANVNYPPHFLFSIYGVDRPVGVAASPDGQRIYVSETGGELLIKVFNRDGIAMRKFAPPGTTLLERSPVYLAVDALGRVFVSDRMQNAIYVFDPEGVYQDSILAPDLTLSKYLNEHTGGRMPEGTTFFYNEFAGIVNLTQPGESEQGLPAPDLTAWDPLGVRIDHNGNLLITVVTDHSVRVFPANEIGKASFKDFGGQALAFGSLGQDAGQLLFPNSAVTDSRGRIYVTDGNNGRVSTWDPNGNYLFDFAKGTGEGALNLPRGAFSDDRDRLFIVDAVGQNIKVYDVSGDIPVFLYVFGDYGSDDGMFNYPNDIFVDNTGRLYIADRENNRIQVWSY